MHLRRLQTENAKLHEQLQSRPFDVSLAVQVGQVSRSSAAVQLSQYAVRIQSVARGWLVRRRVRDMCLSKLREPPPLSYCAFVRRIPLIRGAAHLILRILLGLLCISEPVIACSTMFASICTTEKRTLRTTL